MKAAHTASNSAYEQMTHPINDTKKTSRSQIPDLELSFTSIFILFYHLSKIGFVIFTVYMLEYYPPFPDSQQLDCDIDLFIFLIMICTLIGLFSIKPNTCEVEKIEGFREEKQLKHKKDSASLSKKHNGLEDDQNETRQNGLPTPTRRKVSKKIEPVKPDEIASILNGIEGYSLKRDSIERKNEDNDSNSRGFLDTEKQKASTIASPPIDTDSVLEDILLYEDKKDKKGQESFDLGILSDLPIFATNADTDVLNIHQNLELKGFMTICFLFYQFTNAHTYEALKGDLLEDELNEIDSSSNNVDESTNYFYNMSRIFISLFLFLTGFGHTMYCYKKNDYSLNRFVQVLLRINMSGMFLCMALGKPYIFYKACWLHSYFFIIIFLAMKWKHDLNYTKFGLRLKMAFLAILIFLLWDCDYGLWSIHVILFGTSQQPVDGAPYGQLWEFYFRGFMHHWVPFIGMIFAINHPVTSLLIRRLEVVGPSTEVWFKSLTGLFLVSATVVWALGPFESSKFIYNATNPYFGALPVLCYIYFRNINQIVRSYHVESFKAIGVYSLEIYLLHIHLFVGEDKTTKTLLPGYPTCNLLCIIWLTAMIAKSLKISTTVVTSMLSTHKKNRKRCERHMLILFGTLAIIHAFSTIFEFMQMLSPEVIVTSTIVCGILLYQTVIDSVWHESNFKTAKGTDSVTINSMQTSNTAISSVSKTSPPVVGAVMILLFCLIWQIISMSGYMSPRSLAATCIDNVNEGSWVPIDICSEFQKSKSTREHYSRSSNANTKCTEIYQWGWNNAALSSRCKYHFHSHIEAQRKMNGKAIVFIGDSMTRNLFLATCRAFGDSSAGVLEQDLPIHSEITKKFGTVTLNFQWAPLASDVLSKLNINEASADLIVAGSGVMDKLHLFATDEDKQSHKDSLDRLANGLQMLKGINIHTVWFTPTVVNTKALSSEEKRTQMGESSMEEIRSIYEDSGVNNAATFVLEGHTFTQGQAHLSYDGINYPPRIYDVGAQIMMNALDWIYPEIRLNSKHLIDDSFEPRTGAMANQYLGLMVLSLFVIGIFFNDAFFGLFYVSSIIVRPNGLSRRYPVSIYSFSPLNVFHSIHQFMQKQMKTMNDLKMMNSLDGRKIANQSDDIVSILSSFQNRRSIGNLDTISEDSNAIIA